MRSFRRGAVAVRSAALIVVALAGCAEVLPPDGHVILYVDADAPLPNAPGSIPVAGAPAALFDRVRVELFAPDGATPCDGCVREFDLDQETVRGGATFKIVAADGASRARLLLFRGTPLGPEPAPQSTIELVMQLPELPSEGAVEVTAFLPTEALGVPIGSLDEPVPAALGWSGAGHAGDWKPAQRVPCVGDARPGEVCIPGGAYWMGHRTMVGLPGRWAANVERLVVVSPFWMDSTEVTVSQFRDVMTTPFESTGTNGAIPWTGHYATSPDDPILDSCTFTVAPEPAHDRLPVNCVWRRAAEAFCANKGSRLPTEAEFEFVAGAFESRLHVWGSDEPSCDDAVWGRSTVVPHKTGDASPCVAEGAIALPLELFDAEGTVRAGRDRVEIEGGTVFDLAGNVGEWTSDTFNEPWEACWNREGSQVFVNPSCAIPGEEGEGYHAVRGGLWYGPAALTRAAARYAQSPDPGVHTGFRCVRSATAP